MVTWSLFEPVHTSILLTVPRINFSSVFIYLAEYHRRQWATPWIIYLYCIFGCLHHLPRSYLTPTFWGNVTSFEIAIIAMKSQLALWPSKGVQKVNAINLPTHIYTIIVTRRYNIIVLVQCPLVLIVPSERDDILSSQHKPRTIHGLGLI